MTLALRDPAILNLMLRENADGTASVFLYPAVGQGIKEIVVDMKLDQGPHQSVRRGQ